MEARQARSTDLIVLNSARSVLLLIGIVAGLRGASASIDPQLPQPPADEGPETPVAAHRATREPENGFLSEERPNDLSTEPRNELFERVSARHSDFVLQVLPASHAAAPERADTLDSPRDAQDPALLEPAEKSSGDRPVDRRPAIDPNSSLEGSPEPQL